MLSKKLLASILTAGTIGLGAFTTVAQPFQQGTVNPQAMYPYDITKSKDYEIIMLGTLQGVVAKQSPTQLYLYSTVDGSYTPTPQDQALGLTTGPLFFKYYLNNTRSPIIPDIQNPSKNIWDVVSYYKEYVNGYVLYNVQTDSQDIAVTLCGLLNCIALTPDIAQTAQANGIKQIADATTMSYTDIINQYADQLNKTFTVELIPYYTNWPDTTKYTKADGPKDYTVMLNGMMFYSYANNATRDQVLSFIRKANPNAFPVYGWNAEQNGEEGFVRDVSANGDFVVASDNSIDLSFFASSNTKPLSVKAAPSLKYDSKMSYVTFLVSDGDNLQLVTNKANDARWWGNSNRGKFPVGWTMPPSMYYLESDVWNYFVTTSTDNDELVAGPSGIGYIFGGVASTSQFANQQSDLNEFMLSAGVKTVAIFGDTSNDWSNNNFLSPYLNNAAVSGAFYCQYASWMGQTSYDTKWFNNKPMMPQNEYLNNNPSVIANEINSKLKNKNNGFYAVYAIRNDGCNTMDWLATLYNSLDKTKVQVVLPSQLADLATQANKKKF
ncbi:MAG: hypothetical protein WCR55_08790 [Lentisphaerota bacterium]